MLDHRRWQWPNIKPALGRCLLFDVWVWDRNIHIFINRAIARVYDSLNKIDKKKRGLWIWCPPDTNLGCIDFKLPGLSHNITAIEVSTKKQISGKTIKTVLTVYETSTNGKFSQVDTSRHYICLWKIKEVSKTKDLFYTSGFGPYNNYKL